MKVTVNRALLEKRMALLESNVEKGNLIKALKDDDEQKVKDAFGVLVRNSMKYSSPQSELQMSTKEFSDFKSAIFNGDLDAARKLFGVTKPGAQQTTATHNPVTGKPWSSGPVRDDQLASDLVSAIAKFKSQPDTNGIECVASSCSSSVAPNGASVIIMINFGPADEEYDDDYYMADFSLTHPPLLEHIVHELSKLHYQIIKNGNTRIIYGETDGGKFSVNITPNRNITAVPASNDRKSAGDLSAILNKEFNERQLS